MSLSNLSDFIRSMIGWFGDNPDRQELTSTPDRFLKTMKGSLYGYGCEIKEILHASSLIPNFGYEDMIIIKDIPLFSYCEHHIVPIRGFVTVSYIPRDFIIGISSVYRLVGVLSAKLQIQERIGLQVAETLFNFLNPTGVIVSIKAEHDCIKHSLNLNSNTGSVLTSCAFGLFKSSSELRSEFFQRSS